MIITVRTLALPGVDYTEAMSELRERYPEGTEFNVVGKPPAPPREWLEESSNFAVTLLPERYPFPYLAIAHGHPHAVLTDEGLRQIEIIIVTTKDLDLSTS